MVGVGCKLVITLCYNGPCLIDEEVKRYIASQGKVLFIEWDKCSLLNGTRVREDVGGGLCV